MPTTRAIEKTIPEIDSKLKTFGGDMVKIEYLENCLKQLLPNDIKRFCYLKLADQYALRLMWPLAARNMDHAAETATNFKDKINFYLKEIDFLIKSGDYLFIDKAFKKALESADNREKELIKATLKGGLMTQAREYESKNKRSSAVQIYERLLDMSIITDEERKHLIEKLGKLNSGLGRIREAIRYEQMSKKPTEYQKPRDNETNVKKLSFEDLGIDTV